MDNQEKLAT